MDYLIRQLKNELYSGDQSHLTQKQWLGVCNLISMVFSQIYYRTDRDRFSHNWNRCILPTVGFLTYNGTIFCNWFNRLGRYETLKKNLFFNKKFRLSSPISIHNMFKISSKMSIDKIFPQTCSHINLSTCSHKL